MTGSKFTQEEFNTVRKWLTDQELESFWDFSFNIMAFASLR